MTEHVNELLQFSAGLAGSAFEGLVGGLSEPMVLLSFSAVLLALVMTRKGASSAAPDGVAVVPDAPGATWEADASLGAIVADSDGALASAVLTLETPGGGE
jgi:hypothetical protein